jgi:GntR family transcriptional regulator
LVAVIISSNRLLDGNSANGIISIMEVDRNEATALHVQVAAEIRRSITDGEILQGERLPPVVDLATVLGVNKNTVIRAMHQLRDEGLLDFTRGRGIRVVGSSQKSALLARIGELLEFARSEGYRVDEVVSMMRWCR